MAEADLPQHIQPRRPDAPLDVMLRIDDVFRDSGHRAELTRKHAARRSHLWIIERRQNVIQPGRIAGQTMRRAEVNQFRTLGHTQDTVQCSGDVEVMAIVPEQSYPVITGCQFECWYCRYRRVVDDQQFAAESAGVERGEVLLDNWCRP